MSPSTVDVDLEPGLDTSHMPEPLRRPELLHRNAKRICRWSKGGREVTLVAPLLGWLYLMGNPFEDPVRSFLGKLGSAP